ncbi:hypothetical protein CK934_27520 [Chitinophaga sp. MD30]|nr:hypothetical protein CK934_27520 [Chitinophaga sp. MD30]
MKFRKFISYLPLFILLIAMLYSVYVTNTTNIILLDKHYVGAFLLILCIIFSMRKPKIGKILTLITLVLGTTNIIAFTPEIISYSIGFSINNSAGGLRIQEFSLIVLIIFIIINIRTTINLIRKAILPKSELE